MQQAICYRVYQHIQYLSYALAIVFLKRIQSKSCAHIEDKAGTLPAVPGLGGRVQSL